MNEGAELSQQDQALLELLPWYVNETLAEPERSAVEQLVNSNLMARKEYETLKAIQQGCVDERPAVETADKWPQLLERIDAYETTRQSGLADRLMWALRNLWSRIDWGTRRVSGAIILTQATAIAGLAIALLWPQPSDTGSGLAHTLSSPSVVGSHRYRIMVAPGMPERRLRQLLLELDAQLVSGPSPAGVYTIAVMSKERAAAAASQFTGELRFFEPVDGG